MKTLIQSLAILIVLIAFFSTIPYEVTLREYTPAEIESNGNWAVPGIKGQPVPGGSGDSAAAGQAVHGEGEPMGSRSSFSFGSNDAAQGVQLIADAAAEDAAENVSPISVEVVTEQQQQSNNLENVNRILCGIAQVLLVVFLTETIALLFSIYRERRQTNGEIRN